MAAALCIDCSSEQQSSGQLESRLERDRRRDTTAATPEYLDEQDGRSQCARSLDDGNSTSACLVPGVRENVVTGSQCWVPGWSNQAPCLLA